MADAQLLETEEAATYTWKLDEPNEVPGANYLDGGIAMTTQPVAVSVFNTSNNRVLGDSSFHVVYHEDQDVFRLHLDLGLRGVPVVIRATY